MAGANAARLNFARDVLKDPETGKIREASLCIAIKQMYDLPADFDPTPFIQKLADEPQNYARILNALSEVAEAGLRYDRLRSEVAHRVALSSKGKFDPKTAGLPDQTRFQTEDDFNLFDRHRRAHKRGKVRKSVDKCA